MAGQYERFDDAAVVVPEDENFSTSGSEGDSTDHPVNSAIQPIEQISVSQLPWRVRMMDGQWPTQVGGVHLTVGVLLTLLGLIQVIAIPLAEDTTGGFHIFHLDRQNTFGCGIWAGLLLIVSGTVALRAAIYHDITAVYMFFLVTVLQTIIFTGMVFLVLISYSENWITPTAYDDRKGGKIYFGLQVAVSCFIGVCVLLVLHAFTKYYEVVFFGDLQMCRHWLHCCAPCWCPHVADPEELTDENLSVRPPSLPV